MADYAMDRIGVQERLQAVGLIRQGRVYDLAAEFSNDMPQGDRGTFSPYSLTQYHTPKALTEDNTKGFDFSMDVVSCCLHLGTHIDGLVHVMDSGRIYGGESVRDAFGMYGWKKHGIETVPPILGRGVLIDMAGYYGMDMIEDGFEIPGADLEAALKKQGTEIRKGDIVLFRTGKFKQFLKKDEAYFAAQPGVGPEGAIWLYEQGMAVLGSDTTATEPAPFPDPMHTTHCAMMTERGVHVMELMDLEALAADRVYEFFFAALPLKFVGATGSWLRPVAII